MNHLRALAFLVIGISCSIQAHAGVESELKKMTGYTIIYGGYVKDRIEKNYTEKYLQLDNGWVFKLNCMMFMPMNMTDVVVFWKELSRRSSKTSSKLTKAFAVRIQIVN